MLKLNWTSWSEFTCKLVLSHSSAKLLRRALLCISCNVQSAIYFPTLLQKYLRLHMFAEKFLDRFNSNNVNWTRESQLTNKTHLITFVTCVNWTELHNQSSYVHKDSRSWSICICLQTVSWRFLSTRRRFHMFTVSHISDLQSKRCTRWPFG